MSGRLSHALWVSLLVGLLGFAGCTLPRGGTAQPSGAGGEGGAASSGGGLGGDGATGGDGGAGASTSVTTGPVGCQPQNCPGDDTSCSFRGCVAGKCVQLNAPADTVCVEGGKVCDGRGNCVVCTRDSHCGIEQFCTPQNVCLPRACVNSMLDGNETDVDCGGTECPDCAVGKTCLKLNDCESRYCEAGTCTACTQDTQCLVSDFCDTMTGVCTVRAANGQACTGGNECASGLCVDGFCCNSACAGTCESCGLAGKEGSCENYPDGMDPELECGADKCNGKGSCRCADGVKNGLEVDVDCGGGICDACADFLACTGAIDCVSGVCSSSICQPPACDDTVTNGAETDLDCGGTSCDPCDTGQICLVGTDCTSGVCTGAVCQAATCTDSTKNQDESDVDCGGPNCAPCPDGSDCTKGDDCQSATCLNGSCFGECVDMVLNGNETDVDCGGNVCGPCIDGKTCAIPNDCNSGVCTGSVCQVPACDDTVTNGSETDIDCGGVTCAPCFPGQACIVGADCDTGVCTGGLCQAPTCTDGVKNQDETDIDCGGFTCAGCAPTKACFAGPDCLSGICDVNNVCSCSLDLNIPADGSSGGNPLPDVVMSEISPGQFIELFNTTNAPIDLANATFEFCSPFDYESVASLAMMNLSTIIPAKGYYMLPWPMTFTDTTNGGEILLYSDNEFNNENKILDFVCWGNNPHNSRLGQAKMVGKWDNNDDCIGGAVMQAGSLHRVAGTLGVTEGSYDFASAPTGMTCGSP